MLLQNKMCDKIVLELNLLLFYFGYKGEIDFKLLTGGENVYKEFEKLLQENLLPLERYVKFKVNNKFDAEDIIQDVCLTATKKFSTLKKHEAFKAWLIGIAKFKINDYYRQKAKVLQIPIDALSDYDLCKSRMGITERSVVKETLDMLGDKDKQILYLYYFKHLSQDDISKQLAVPLGTVKSRLHYAKEKFKSHYPKRELSKGEAIMKRFPDILPKYEIEELDAPAFPVVFEELPNWCIAPKLGEKVSWASYDMPGRNITEIVHSKVVSKALIHGVEGVEILTESENKGGECSDPTPHTYYAQLTDTHCRWLGESYIDKNGFRRVVTFLDGDDFISEWGYGEENIGSETHLEAREIIKRKGDTIGISTEKHIMDVVGRYKIRINNSEYDTICLIEYFENGVLTETYIDKNGKTVLWRRFNKNDWANNRYGKLWTEMLPKNETYTVNGAMYVHWYDCITYYIL